jgi:hypothetical protein
MVSFGLFKQMIAATHLLVVVCDDVGGSGAWILNLDSAIGGEGEQTQRTVVVQAVCAMLPEDSGLDTSWVRSVGLVSVLSLLEESIVRAGFDHQLFPLFH